MPFQIFEGCFDSFQEAEGSLDFFESDSYMEKVLSRLRDALTKQPTTNDYILTPIAGALWAEKGDLTVLDYGGGAGISFLPLQDLPNLRFDVFDNPSVCALGKQYVETLESKGHIKFHQSRETLAPHYNLVHLGSVIQYVKEVSELLSFIASKDPDYILVSDTMVGTKRSFVTTANWHGHRHPHRFFSFADLIELFDRNSYSLSLKMPFIPEIAGVRSFYDMSNLPIDCRVDHALHLLFRRTK